MITPRCELIVVNSSKNTPIKYLMCEAKEWQPIISDKSNKGERKNTRYLFTQFSPTMTYSGGESNSLFHYISEFGYNEISKVITRINLQS
jgi:hypothetical protein